MPAVHVANTNAYRHPEGADPARMRDALLAEVEETIEREGAGTIAMLIAEPVQNAGGCLVPPDGYWAGLREICDRHGILLVADDVICAFGRIGSWFGAQRLGFAAMAFLGVVVTLPFAFASWFVVERPCIRWARRWPVVAPHSRP